MKQRTFLESFIVRPRPVFKISSFLSSHYQNYTEAGLNIQQILNLIKYIKILTCKPKYAHEMEIKS